MRKRNIILLIVAALLTGALAQDVSISGLDTRLSIIETRVSRLEADLSRLSGVPTQLGRIEEKVTALTEQAGDNSAILQTVGLGIVLSVITGAIGFMQGKARTK